MMVTIDVSRFQPFSSRIGRDVVVRLAFIYNKDLVSDLKTLIHKYEPRALRPDTNVLAAGGWLPKFKCWFVEESIWSAVKEGLLSLGYSVNEPATKAVAR
jgi:hypothetical protein